MTKKTCKIFCGNCNSIIIARLTTGREVYRHIPRLNTKRFWKCDSCGGFVGTHADSKDHKPLGTIPTPEVKEKRKEIHKLLDPIWSTGRVRRGEVYRTLANFIGRQYHTAEINTVDEADKVIAKVKEIRTSVGLITF